MTLTSLPCRPPAGVLPASVASWVAFRLWRISRRVRGVLRAFRVCGCACWWLDSGPRRCHCVRDGAGGQVWPCVGVVSPCLSLQPLREPRWRLCSRFAKVHDRAVKFEVEMHIAAQPGLALSRVEKHQAQMQNFAASYMARKDHSAKHRRNRRGGAALTQQVEMTNLSPP